MLRRFAILLCFGAAAVVSASPARALTVEAAIERFFTAEELKPDWFAPNFLQAVPFERLEPIRAQMTEGLGDYERTTSEGDRYMARFEGGRIPVFAALDPQGRFVGLRLLIPIRKLADLQAVQSEFDALPGVGHLLVSVDGEQRLAQRADEAMAVGSAFKLLVLKVLVEEIEGGRRSWSDVVELQEGHGTMGDGTLGRWPSGSPLTLHTAAVLMISESDNTATDLLIRILGRDRISAADPSGRNRPFLSTREAFQLKDPRNDAWRQRWSTGDRDERERVLDELAERPAPDLGLYAQGTPVHPEVEWFFTARELCELISALQPVDLMTVNPGVLDRDAYERVAFKGGSEPGVLNLTTWALDENGREICVCATRNAEEALDVNELGEVVIAAFELVSNQP